MRQEWREYWKECLRSLRGFVWAVLIALLFFFVNLPGSLGQWKTNLFISLGFAFFVFACIWTSYAILWAILTIQLIKTGKIPVIIESKKLHFAVSAPAAIVGIIIAEFTKSHLLGTKVDYVGFLQTALICSFISLMFIFYSSYKRAKEENLKLQASSMEANYNVLKNQMQPHFLFNSLNSLSELIQQSPESAAEMTQKLSDLYREILSNSKEKTATLASELGIVEKYLELEKLRYGNRLNFELPKIENGRNFYLPSLILQTLVENSIKHGIAKSVDGGKISIVIERVGNKFQIIVSNTSNEPLGPTNRGTGIQNTKSRLDLLYGNTHEFSLKWEQGKATACFFCTGEQVI